MSPSYLLSLEIPCNSKQTYYFVWPNQNNNVSMNTPNNDTVELARCGNTERPSLDVI